jgi:hypothetical protein
MEYIVEGGKDSVIKLMGKLDDPRQLPFIEDEQTGETARLPID